MIWGTAMSVRVQGGWWRMHQTPLLRSCPCVVVPCRIPATRVSSSTLREGSAKLIRCEYSPKPPEFSVDYDPFEDFFGLGIDMKMRKHEESIGDSESSYMEHQKHVPCPVCRGRGYVLDGPKGPNSCSYCVGKGMVLEDSVWESAWETAHTRSPLMVEDDESLDKLDADVPERPEKRVYGPRPKAVRNRISRSLKELERRTGALSKRAKHQHQNPMIHSRMVAAIKAAKNTDAAKLKVSENQKRFFQNPENRRMRGLQMKGVKFSCKNCGKEGHRRHYCPELGYVQKTRSTEGVYRCGVCGQAGHTRRRCPGRDESERKEKADLRTYEGRAKGVKRGPYKCGLCQGRGHSRKTCAVLQQQQQE